MRELLRLLLCTLCLTAAFANTDLALSKERAEYLRTLLDRGVKALERGESLRPDVYEEPDLANFRVEEKEQLKQCPKGWAGNACKNPVCDTKIPTKTHDGTVKDGETIDVAMSDTCSDKVYFPIDSYLEDIVISAFHADKTPISVSLYDTQGQKVQETGVQLDGDYSSYLYKSLLAQRTPGKFFLTLSSDSNKPCIVTVNAKTPVVVDGGFITDQHSDDVLGQVNGNPVWSVPSYLAFKVSATHYPAQPLNVKLFYENKLQNSPYDLTKRYHCYAASIISTPYTCDVIDIGYYVKYIGIDNNGFFFQRVYDYSCEAKIATGPTPTPTPGTTQLPPNVCLNGGTLLNPGMDSRLCYCGDLYRGRQCEEKICFNDGILNGDQCVCAKGFDGDHCLDVRCEVPSDGSFDLTSRALVFIVRGGASMKSHLKNIYNAATMISNVFNNEDRAGYFETYIFIEYNNHNIAQMVSTRDSAEFLEAIAKVNTTPSTYCQDSTLATISTALQMHDVRKYPNSPVFIFSDGLPDDSDLVRVNLINQLSYFRGQLNFMMLKDPSVGCELDTSLPSYRTLRELAQFSQGIVARVDSADLAGNMLSVAFASMNGDYIHSNDFFESCNNAPPFQSVFIDESATSFYVMSSGDNLNFTVITPQRKVAVLHQSVTNKDLGVFFVDTNGISGNYLITVNSPQGTPCHYRVFERMSKYDMFFSTSQGVFDDSYSVEPLYNQGHNMVARINNLPNSEKRRLQAEMMIWTNEGLQDTRRILFASSGIYRDACDYNLYFDSWTCDTRDMVFYVTVFVNDGNGFLVQRTTPGICSAIIPPPVPPSGCLNGGVASGSTNGSCICPPGYQGDKCQSIVCQNGGKAQASGYCACSAGFSGQFCEIATCFDYNTRADFIPNRRSMTFFVHDSQSTTTMLQAMSAQAAQMVQDIQNQHGQWINHWQLITFTDSNFTVAADSDNPNAFISGLKNIVAHNPQSSYTCTDLNLLEPMYHAMQDTSFTTGGFVFVFLDGIMKHDPENFDNVFQVSQFSQNPITFVQFERSLCGVSSTDSRIGLMSGLAQATGGDYIQLVKQEDAGSAMKAIPALYSSNLIFEQNIADCSNPVKFYFPIESQTQSFSINIVGSLKSNPIYTEPLQSDEENSDYEPFTFWNELGVGRYDYIVRSCDDAFDSHDSQCYYTADEPESWSDAQQTCHNMNAALVTVLTKDVQTYLDSIDGNTDYWLGLNDLTTAGSWEWDQADGHEIALSGFTNWGPNQPGNSTTNRCVFQQGSSSKKWIAADCSQRKQFMCVKHPYDANYEPSDVTRVHLPRGMWTAQVQTWSGACSVRIRAQSGIRLYAAYAKQLHDDFGYPEMIPGKKANNYMIAHITGFARGNAQASGKLEFAEMYANNMSMILAEPFYPRENCAFDFVSRPFACPSAAFSIAATGMDSYGYPFQRIISAMCYGGNTDKTCDNNGIFDPSRGSCICPPDFIGDRCEFTLCQHGFVGAGFECECEEGWTGRTCELPMCLKPSVNSHPFLSSVDKTFVVALDGCHSGLQEDVLKKIDTLLNDVIAAAKKRQPVWFTEFVGIVFRAPTSTAALSNVISHNDSATFVSDILKEVSANSDKCAGSSDRLMMNALIEVMNSPNIAFRSQAFLITNGFAGDYGNARAAMDAIALTHTYVNVLVMGDQAAPGNGNYSSPQVQSMMRIAHNSGGSFYQLPGYERLHKLLVGDMGTLFNNYYMGTRFQQDCANFNEYIQIGAETSVIALDIFAQTTPVINIVDPLGTPVLPTLVAMTATNALYLITNKDLPPGLWRVSIDHQKANAGACIVNVRGVSPEDVYVAFTQDVGIQGGVHSDQINAFPVPGEENAVLVTNSFGTSVYAQIFTNDERKLLWASPLIRRHNSCTYVYISRDTFECPAEKSFSMAIDGFDDRGNPFRRITTVHCG